MAVQMVDGAKRSRMPPRCIKRHCRRISTGILMESCRRYLGFAGGLWWYRTLFRSDEEEWWNCEEEEEEEEEAFRRFLSCFPCTALGESSESTW